MADFDSDRDNEPGERPGADDDAVRQWPADEPLDPATALAAECASCGQAWRIHPDLAGFRLRCGCGNYVAVPKREVPRARARWLWRARAGKP